MTESVRDWLPVGAAAHSAVRDRLDAAVDAWSGRWFARTQIRLAALEGCAEAPRLGGERPVWRIHGQGVAVGTSRTTRTRLTALALDAPADTEPPRDMDSQLLAAFEQRLMDDLALMVEASLGRSSEPLPEPRTIENPLGRDGGAVATLAADTGGPLIWLAIPLALAIPICRPAPARRGPSGLVSRRTALGESPLRLQALLGLAELSVADLRGLAVGDVLVLDTLVNAGAAARLAIAGRMIAAADLTELGDHKALALHHLS